VILHGQCSVRIPLAYEEGAPVVLTEVGVLEDGDAFGEFALINNKPRAASIY
jgi:hypothetical protein